MKFLQFLLQSPEGKLWTTPTPERWTVGNEHNGVWGGDLASAATIVITHKYHRVTGTTQIDTITPPWTTFAGDIFLSFAGAVAVSAAGNVDITFTSAANEFAHLIYNPARGKWSGALINAVT